MGAERPERVNPKYLQPGTEIGYYTVLDQIGCGGLAAVYRVRRGPQQFALKISTYSTRDLSPTERSKQDDRAKREFGALASLNHPNIVQVRAFDRWPDPQGYPYLVMDLVEGEPLYDWQAATNPSLRRLADLFITVADALHEMHRLMIVHRDLKSDNMLVRASDGGGLVIVDFNIARPASSYTLTESGSILGTPTHLTPEYCKYLQELWRSLAAGGGDPGFNFGAPQELHSVGFMLYEMCCGTAPFPSSEEGDTFQTMARIQNTVPRPLHEVNPAIPLPLSQIVMTCLQRDPANRYQSAEALREALEAIRGNLSDEPFPCPIPPARSKTGSSSSAASRGSLSSASGSQSDPLRTKNDRPAKVARSRWRGLPAVLVGTSTAAVLALAAVVAWRSPRLSKAPADFTPMLVQTAAKEASVAPTSAAGSRGGEQGTPSSARVGPAGAASSPEGVSEIVRAPIVPAPTASPIPVMGEQPKHTKPSNIPSPAPTSAMSARVVPADHQPRQRDGEVLVHARRAVNSQLQLGVPAGSRIRARLSVDVVAPGQRAEASLARPFLLGAQSIFPSRTRMLGAVVSNAGGRIKLRFDTALLPDGTELRIDAIGYSSDDGPHSQLSAGAPLELVLQQSL